MSQDISTDDIILGIVFFEEKYMVVYKGAVVRMCEKRGTALIETAALIDSLIEPEAE